MKATLLLTTTLCSLLSLSSCKSSQKTESQQSTETKMEQKETFIKEGYTAGIITQTKEKGNCEWTITLENGVKYESMVMKDEFKKDGMKVFFKFLPQRRMSRCANANPIEIIEIIAM